MITIEIDDDKTVSVKHNGTDIGYILEIFIADGTPADNDILMAKVIFSGGHQNPKNVAQVLKDHGFNVFIEDFNDTDEYGNPFEYVY